MSRTDKDRPAWVVNHEIGRIEHDHRTGDCAVQTLAYSRAWHAGAYHGWRHRCAKRVEVAFACTRAEPHLERWRLTRRCWVGGHTRVERADGSWVWEYTWRGCVGHTRVEHHPDIPCACDDWPEPPTCRPGWEFGSHTAANPAPRWFRDHLWNGPERRRERDDLTAMVKAANAHASRGGDLTRLADPDHPDHLPDPDDAVDGPGGCCGDWDFANHQHRHGATHAWW